MSILIRGLNKKYCRIQDGNCEANCELIGRTLIVACRVHQRCERGNYTLYAKPTAKSHAQKGKSLALHMTSGFLRRRGIEPRPIAWKAIMLTTTPTPLFSGNQDASQLMVIRSKFEFVYGGAGKRWTSYCNMHDVHRGFARRDTAKHNLQQ